MTVQASVSRFHLLDRPLVAPAKCIVCGNGIREVIDFGRNIEWYGAVYMCVDCLGEAARVVGLISPSDATSERLKSEQSANTYLSDNNLVAVSREFFDIATDSVRSLSDALSSAVYDVSLEDAHDEPEADSGDSGTEPTGAGDANEGAKQSNSTSRKRRSTSVPSDSSDGLFE